MEEAYWMNSMFSVARHYGGIRIEGQEFDIVNKEGRTLVELSLDDSIKGKAIPPGEPADLIDKRFIPIYKKMGREAFIKWLEKNQQADSKALLKEGKELVKNIKKNGRK